MKKLLALVTASVMALSMVACGGSTSTSTATSTASTASTSTGGRAGYPELGCLGSGVHCLLESHG